MNNVSNVTAGAPYSVRCTECGEVLENKFFPLDNLLVTYQIGANTDKQRLFHALGIGANYGETVLPKAPALLQTIMLDGAETLWVVTPRSHEIEGRSIGCFDEELAAIHPAQLTAVYVSISSMVAQFALTTKFDDIYGMLRLRWEFNQNGFLPDEKANEMAQYRNRFKKVPGVRLSNLTVDALVQKETEGLLDLILDYAQQEAAMGGDHFAVNTLCAAWQYELINDRKLPKALAVFDDKGMQQLHCTKCCCTGCRRPVPVQLGAYDQKIVGILGTQATGKSTYLAALTDAITIGEATTAQQSNGELRDTKITIRALTAGNTNWERISKEPQEGDGGLLWLYQHGFPPRATDNDEMLALSFLIHSDRQEETVMYTLVDIAGEVFFHGGAGLPENAIKRQKAMLSACDALLFVVSSRQLQTAQRPNTLNRSPHEVLASCNAFLPKRAIPIAVVLTSADEINGGDLRKALQVPYDIKNCKPLAWSEGKQKLVYNGEAMDNAGRAVREFVDKNFGVFVQNLQSLMEQAGSDRAAGPTVFAVSSGTQHAPFYFTDAEMPANFHTEEAMRRRLEEMREGRFGVTAPLLWLLACDGILERNTSAETPKAQPEGKQPGIQGCLRRLSGLLPSKTINH